jgi:hypothetical protein
LHDHGSCSPIAAAQGHDFLAVAIRSHHQEFGTHVFDRRCYQRGGDFRLLFEIARQPLGRNNCF